MEPATPTTHTVPTEDILKVLRWGGGIRGPAETTYPHPKGWTFSELRTPLPLDRIEVRHLTAAFRLSIEAPPNCLLYWEHLDLPWKALACKYSNGLLTPKDYYSHFKNILHHRILLRSVKPHKGSSRCRCCGRGLENTAHLVTCQVLRRIWSRFNKLVQLTHRPSKLTPRLIFHAVDEEGRSLPPGLAALHLVIWKILLYHITQVDTEGVKFNASCVWNDSIRRFESRVNALAFKVTRKAVRDLGRGDKIREPDAENRRLARPLVFLSEWGKVSRHACFESAVTDVCPSLASAGEPGRPAAGT